MFIKDNFNLVIAIVSKGFSDQVITASKQAGAEGATIINARGSGVHERDTFLGVAIQPEKEVVMILIRKAIRKKVMREIVKNCSLNDEGRGVVFSLPVDEIGGISHLMQIAIKTTKKPASKSTKKVDEKKNEPVKKVEKTEPAQKENEPEKTQKSEEKQKDENIEKIEEK